PISTSSSGLMLWIADQMVVSVGPYMFQSEPQRGSNARASSAVQASPPHKTFRRGWPVQPDANISRQVVGVACMTVAAERSNSSLKQPPSMTVSDGAITTRPPTLKGNSNSRTAMSNDKVVTASQVSAAVMFKSARRDSTAFTTARWEICTPLGRPVEPDV